MATLQQTSMFTAAPPTFRSSMLLQVASGICSFRSDSVHGTARRGPHFAASGFESRVGSLPKVSAVLFAAEEVLYDSTDWWRWVVRQLARSGLATHYNALYTVWRRDYLDPSNQSGEDYWAAFQSFLLSLGCCPAQAAELATAARPRRSHFEQTIRVNPGVQETLTDLRVRGIQIGVVSCAPITNVQLQQRLAQLELGSMVDWSSTTRALGVCSSDGDAYRTAAAMWGVEATEVAFVGRHAIEVEAAGSAGMVAIDLAGSRDCWNEIRVDHVGALPKLIRGSN